MNIAVIGMNLREIYNMKKKTLKEIFEDIDKSNRSPESKDRLKRMEECLHEMHRLNVEALKSMKNRKKINKDGV